MNSLSGEVSEKKMDAVSSFEILMPFHHTTPFQWRNTSTVCDVMRVDRPDIMKGEKKRRNTSANMRAIKFKSLPLSPPQIPCEPSFLKWCLSHKKLSSKDSRSTNIWNVQLSKADSDTDDQEFQAVGCRFVTLRARNRY